MKIASVVFFASVAAAFAQNRVANWPAFGDDPQRSGWAKSESRIAPDTVKDFQLLWKIKLENQPKSPRALTPPLIIGRLISYRGFRELAIVGSSSEVVYAIDADLGSIFWQRHLEYSTIEPQVTASSATCPGGLTAMPAMPSTTPSPEGRGGRGAAAPGRGAAARGGFASGQPSVYALSSDGRIHRLNTSTGDDMTQPVSVLPANARAYALNMLDGVVYTVTGHECNGVVNAVWAIDLTGDTPKTASFPLKDSEPAGIGGVAIGTNRTVYVQTGDALLALTARGLAEPEGTATSGRFALELRQSFPIAGAATPVVFPYKDRDLVVAAGKDGSLYLLDTAILSQTAAGGSIGEGLSTWEDQGGVRWIFAPMNNTIAAYKLEETDGKPALTPAWVSREIAAPLPPVIANGVVFVLSGARNRATLYALDAATGKQLYSSRNLANAPSALTGITVSNARVYFATSDGVLYCFGLFMEH